MSFRNLTSEHDWTFGAGRSNYVNESNEIALNVKTRILSFLGDCFFAANAGIDWWNRLDIGEENNLDMELQDTISKTPGVLSIEDAYVYTTAGRKLIANYTIKDIYSSNISDELKIL